MSYKYSKGSQVIGDLKAADDTQRDTVIDFGEDQIALQTSGSTKLTVDNNGASIGNFNLGVGMDQLMGDQLQLMLMEKPLPNTEYMLSEI